ncbi:hypothetical protein BD779DRAFT_1668535 [Infundibulicybe gibba]|nr:hypothetical protein BD779DRAFT_1668535 [Infundibulicybe gibba]
MPPILSFTAATPQPSPISPILQNQSKSLQGSASVLKIPSASLVQRSTSEGSSKGKRKADEAGVGGGGGTPPKEGREHRATFAADPRPHRVSNNSSRAPSSYHRKRARLSTMPESRPGSRDGSIRENTNAANTGSWSSRGSPKRAASSHHQSTSNLPQRTPSRRSLSQTSIPMSALISPHAPSISRSSTFHMRDPRNPRPYKVHHGHYPYPTPTIIQPLVVRTVGRTRREPLVGMAILFRVPIFPIWWVAAFMTTPKTRRLDGGDAEKGVVLDDPQVEFDAKSWRTRCRVMAVVSLFTYVPFIVLVAIFAPR